MLTEAGAQPTFQSTRPVRGGTSPKSGVQISNPFQSTRPVRGGTISSASHLAVPPFQSTRPVRGGTARSFRVCKPVWISIHPPRAGRDVLPGLRGYPIHDFNPPAPCGAGHASGDPYQVFYHISIHPPRAGRDGVYLELLKCIRGFQSTRPVRGGTGSASVSEMVLINFNPPAPCGAGRVWQGQERK